MHVKVTLTDLWRDDCGWSENASRVTRATITLPDDASDLAASRAILASVGAQGFRRDGWCDSDFGAWRRGGLGVYADVIHCHRRDRITPAMGSVYCECPDCDGDG